MGTLSHHQAKSAEFLHRADLSISTRDPAEAGVALRRAASHVVTALAVQQGWKHNSRLQLEIVLHANVGGERLSRSHLKTFRQAHTLFAHLSLRPRTRYEGGNPVNQRGNLVNQCKGGLRRMRRRVASLIAHANAIIAGLPKPARSQKLSDRRPDLPFIPDFVHIRDVMSLPNFEELRQRFRLRDVAMATYPDPHGFYERGDTPRRCQCHAELWDRPLDEHRITLSPPWRRALERTFGIRLPDPLHLAC